ILVAEAARVRGKPPQSMDAWDLVMQAVPHMWRMSTQDHGRAQELLQRAIALDAGYAHAHALLGWTYVTMFNLDTRRPIGEFTDQALAAGTTAVMLDDEDPWGHLVVGLGHARRRRPELALQHLSQSIELNPSFALGHAGLGYAMAVGGQPERGLQALDQAPLEPARSLSGGLCRHRAVHGAVRPQKIRRDHRGVPRDGGIASAPRRRLAADDRVVGTARQDRRSAGGARAYAHDAARPLECPCRRQHRLRGSCRSVPLSRGTPQGWSERLAVDKYVTIRRRLGRLRRGGRPWWRFKLT